jgi:hypothetical protein
MIYRIAGNHLTLCFISLIILLGTSGIMTQQVQFLSAHFDQNFIPTEVALENNIAILIDSFGGVPRTSDLFVEENLSRYYSRLYR